MGWRILFVCLVMPLHLCCGSEAGAAELNPAWFDSVCIAGSALPGTAAGRDYKVLCPASGMVCTSALTRSRPGLMGVITNSHSYKWDRNESQKRIRELGWKGHLIPAVGRDTFY